MKVEFIKIYQEIFTPDAAELKKISKIPDTCLKKAIQKFFDSVMYGSEEAHLHENLRWAIDGFFLSEFYNQLIAVNKTSPMVQFHPDRQYIRVNERAYFSVMMVLKRRLEKKIPKLKGTKFPDWFKEEDFTDFEKALYNTLTKPYLCAKIMKGPPKKNKYLHTVSDCLEFVKGKITDRKIQECIDICFERSPGWKNNKGFRTVQEFRKSVDKYFDTINEIIDRYGSMESCRMTKDKAARYLMLLGTCGTLQTRSGEPVSLSTEKECDLFTFYKPLREAAMRLGWMTAPDVTFCPGVRCKSFIIHIMCVPIKVKQFQVFMNPIEKKFVNLPMEEQKAYADSLSPFAFSFLKEKEFIYRDSLDFKRRKEENIRLMMSYHSYKDKNGKEWSDSRFSKKRWNDYECNSVLRRYELFQVKFSNPKIYGFPTYVGVGQELRIA